MGFPFSLGRFFLVEQHLGGGDANSHTMGCAYADAYAKVPGSLRFIVANTRVEASFTTGLVYVLASTFNVVSQPGPPLFSTTNSLPNRTGAIGSLEMALTRGLMCFEIALLETHRRSLLTSFQRVAVFVGPSPDTACRTFLRGRV